MLLTLARLITASLLIASAAAFATGATIERHTASSESQPAQHQHAEAGQPPENPAGTEPAAGRESTATHTTEHNSENLLGINPEATGLVVVAVALSLLLAALILTVGSPLLAAGVALAMLAFTALDIREVAHQLHESHSGLAALAAAIALPPGDLVRIPFSDPSSVEHIGLGSVPTPGGIAQGPDGSMYVAVGAPDTAPASGGVVKVTRTG